MADQISDSTPPVINSIKGSSKDKEASLSDSLDKQSKFGLFKLFISNILRFFKKDKINQNINNLIKITKILYNKKKIFYSLIAAFIIFILIIIGFFIFFPHKTTQSLDTQSPIDATSRSKKTPTITLMPTSENVPFRINNKSLDDMIKKANILYNSGNKVEALSIFDNIATFSRSIANYNLGVIKLKEKSYDEAIKSFSQSISAGENISVSAVNAMVSGYHLGKKELYKKYLEITSSYLPNSSKEPFYSYLYALTQYYNDYYFEALSPLLNPNSQSFVEQNHRLASKIFLALNDDYSALGHLQEIATNKDNKALGLLYARVGEYSKAKSQLYEYLNTHQDDLEARLALQIIDLKLGNFSGAAAEIDAIGSNQELNKKALHIYPIKVVLKPSFFDVGLAQEEFWNRSFEIQEKISYKVLFYYAPYRVFDVDEAIKIIKEGGVFSQGPSIEQAKDMFVRSETISTINKKITKALIELNKNNIRDALKYLLSSAKANPNHAVLHYNLGLIYAQMGNFEQAYFHFMRAYHLNSYDIASGLFAIIAGKFIYQDTSRTFHQISRDFENIPFESQTQKKFLFSLIGYLNNNIDDGLDWIEEAENKLPIYYALRSAYGIRNKDKNTLLRAFSSLKSLYSRDAASNILYELVRNYDTNYKQVALRLHNLLLSNKIDLSSVYYGPAFTRELYVFIGFITGSLQNQEKALEEKLIAQTDTPNGILQAIALVSIYQHKFEKAYTIYNTLIEDLGEADSYTKFLGAVAAIGADHHENAVLLLQLSKMDSPSNYESRYVLGLLYQGAGNFGAAASHYNYISTTDFKSEFFDFVIDTDKLIEAQSVSK